MCRSSHKVEPQLGGPVSLRAQDGGCHLTNWSDHSRQEQNSSKGPTAMTSARFISNWSPQVTAGLIQPSPAGRNHHLDMWETLSDSEMWSPWFSSWLSTMCWECKTFCPVPGSCSSAACTGRHLSEPPEHLRRVGSSGTSLAMMGFKWGVLRLGT